MTRKNRRIMKRKLTQRGIILATPAEFRVFVAFASELTRLKIPVQAELWNIHEQRVYRAGKVAV